MSTMGLGSDRCLTNRLSDKWCLKESSSKPGKYYYYNVQTGQSSWNRPEDCCLEESKFSSESQAPCERKPTSDALHENSVNGHNQGENQKERVLTFEENEHCTKTSVSKKRRRKKKKIVIAKETSHAETHFKGEDTGAPIKDESPRVVLPTPKPSDSSNSLQENTMRKLPTAKKLKEPAQNRLKRLQNTLRSKGSPGKNSKVKTNISTSKPEATLKPSSVNHVKHCPASNNQITAAERLAILQAKLKRSQCLNTVCQSSEQPETKASIIPSVNKDFDAMEVEYMESEVLSDIGELRQNDFGLKLDCQPVFMDIDLPMSQSEHSSALYIVLDTNILLSHLEFTKGLRDTIVPGKGPLHLYLPWQVLHELDHLKEKGNSKIRPLARKAIGYLHENFSSAHPRVSGQKLSDATQNSANCPDDNILESCLQLMNQGYTVVLLSNDKNLLNKALVCEVVALSKDQLTQQLNENESLKSSLNVFDLNKSTGVRSESTNSLNDGVLCEMKSVLKNALSEIVSKGMEDEYKHLWKKRTVISPPWEVEPALHCLAHHWLPICGDFIPVLVKEQIQKLKHFFKVTTLRYGINDADLKESLKLAMVVLKNVPKKYSSVVCAALENLKALEFKLNTGSSIRTNEDYSLMTTEQDSITKFNLVFSCFEEAHNAAQNLCKPESFPDPDWSSKAGCMREALKTLTQLLTLLLSTSAEDLNEENPIVTELVRLISGQNNISPIDLVNFFKQEKNRTVLENGLQQYLLLEAQLANMSQ